MNEKPEPFFVFDGKSARKIESRLRDLDTMLWIFNLIGAFAVGYTIAWAISVVL